MTKTLRGAILILIGLVFFILLFLILLIRPFGEWLMYNLFYYPLYSLFSESLYLSFYLYVIKCAFVVALVLSIVLLLMWKLNLLSKTNKKDDRRGKTLALICLILITLVGSIFFVIGGKDILSDLYLIKRGEPHTLILDEYWVTRTVRKSAVRYELDYSDFSNSSYKNTLKIDTYQYRNFKNNPALSQIEKESHNALSDSLNARDKTLKVIYLPNTRRLVSYRIISMGNK
ncbi:hypothetical protein [Dysgonomonas macrotermitis]|uniref:Uncharacterized protein n=1 Tax=Dysgonomonas macrotermitis TaxID=1346286 RepID=A0A1M5H574_9BACT|nr:hypothetical protein [Dysgonomonas macrotermitis]SHG11147.1 hypothetical protein SAMN05444362_11592 [Dysgonomonas macrotermitis]